MWPELFVFSCPIFLTPINFNKKNTFDVEAFLKHELKMNRDAVFEMYETEVDESEIVPEMEEEEAET